MNNDWDQYADSWDTNAEVVAYSSMAFTELKQITELSGKRILDFGCGTGLLTERMSAEASEIVAIDPSKEMITVLDKKQLSNVSTISDFLSEELIRTHPSFKQPFDLIVASSVCAFLPNYSGVLKHFQTVLDLDGIFVQWDWLSHEDGEEMGLSKNEIQRAFQKAELHLTQLSLPFEMKNGKDSLPVVMAVGKIRV